MNHNDNECTINESQWQWMYNRLQWMNHNDNERTINELQWMHNDIQ